MSEIHMEEIHSATTDFSNPMYEALGSGEAAGAAPAAGQASGSRVTTTTNADINGTSNLLAEVVGVDEKSYLAKGGAGQFASAILSPSSVVHKTPQIQIRQTALDPNTDTDNDTDKLVEEDKSEC